MPLGFPLKPGFRNVAGITKVLMANGDFLAGIQGNTYFASPTGDVNQAGSSPQDATTITGAISRMVSGDRLYLAPGAYAETVTIPRTLANITIQGLGARGAVRIAPTVTNATGLDIRGDDVTLINIQVGGQSTSSTFALSVYGSRFRAIGCVFTTAAAAVILARGTIAQIAAATHGLGANAFFEDCEFTDSTRGLDITSSNDGPVSRCRLIWCLFNNILTCSIRSNDVGGANNCVKSILIDRCIFERSDAQVEPTDHCLLNTTNDNGLITRSIFATTIFNTLTITLATNVKFVANYAEQEGAPSLGGTAGRPD